MHARALRPSIVARVIFQHAQFAKFRNKKAFGIRSLKATKERTYRQGAPQKIKQVAIFDGLFREQNTSPS